MAGVGRFGAGLRFALEGVLCAVLLVAGYRMLPGDFSFADKPLVIDECGFLVVGHDTFRLMFLEDEVKPTDWRRRLQKTTYGYINPNVGKVLIGLVLHLGGYDLPPPRVFPSVYPGARGMVSSSAWLHRRAAEHEPYFILGRQFSQWMMALGAVLVYVIARLCTNPACGLLAWYWFLVSALPQFLANRITTDPILLVAGLGTAITMVLVLDRWSRGGTPVHRRVLELLLIGVLLGITVSVKLNGALLCFAFGLAVLGLWVGGRLRAYRTWEPALWLAGAALLAFGVFVLTTPYVWDDVPKRIGQILGKWDAVLERQVGLHSEVALPEVSDRVRATWNGVVTRSGPSSWGGAATLATILVPAGFLVACWRSWRGLRGREAARTWVALAWILVVVAGTVAWIPQDRERYILPALAPACVLGALAVHALWRTLRSLPVPGLGALAALLLLVPACSRESGKQWNVVLISLDSLRQDHLGVYGHRPRFAPEQPVSPRLDALAAEGVVFDEAWTSTSWTLPAHVSLLTGMTNRGHGVETDAFRLDPRRRTLAEEFQEAGYATAGYFSGPYLDPRHGFGRGFDDYRNAMRPLQEALHGPTGSDAAPAVTGAVPVLPGRMRQLRNRQSHREVTSPRVNEMAEAFLEEWAGRRPFFLFLHYFDIHYDYIPDEAEPGLGRLFDPGYTGTMDGRDWFTNPGVWDRRTRKRRISDRDLAHVEALYDAEIHWVDRHVGAILDRLRELGVYEDTIVCVTSDHGDEFFDHGGIGHGTHLYTELARIPLILRIPGVADDGRRVGSLVRIYDIAPTLLDFALSRTWARADGRSLRDVLLQPESARPRFALARIVRGGEGMFEAWRDDRYTVVRYSKLDRRASRAQGARVMVPRTDRRTGKPVLRVFDRRTDPLEQEALPAGDARYLEAAAAFCRDFRLVEAAHRDLPWSSLEERRAVRFSAEEEVMLAQLGYAETEGDDQVEWKALPVAPSPPPCLE